MSTRISFAFALRLLRATARWSWEAGVLEETQETAEIIQRVAALGHRARPS